MSYQLTIDDIKIIPGFEGVEYDSKYDHSRLTGQIQRVYALMSDGRWRTLQEIADTTHDPHASISAQLRNLRKQKHGGHTVNRRARGDRAQGLFEYQLVTA